MGKYKGLVKWDIPEDLGYDKSALEAEGYQPKKHLNKTNPRLKEYCKDLKKEGKDFKIIDQNRADNMVDVWVKK